MKPSLMTAVLVLAVSACSSDGGNSLSRGEGGRGGSRPVAGSSVGANGGTTAEGGSGSRDASTGGMASSASAPGGSSTTGGVGSGSSTILSGGTAGAGGTLPKGGSGGTRTTSGDSGTAGLTAGGTSGTGGKAGSGGTGSGGQGTGGGGTGSGGQGTGSGGTGSGGQGTVTSGGTGGSGTTGSSCAGPVGTITGALAKGIAFIDDRGKPVNAHGGGIIREGDTYYMHGEYFLDTTTDNDFNGFSMYSSKDLATWKWEKMILPQQPSGLLGPKRKGERPHIIKCPSTGEFVLYAHAASEDYQTDKEVVYATSKTVNGEYTFVGALTNSAGTTAAHSDMSAFADGSNAYVLTESGHVYTLAADCHSWVSDKTYSAVNGDSGGSESPTVFKAGSTYYWIGSYKTGWRANNNFYSTAPAMTGPWTFQGFIAPVKDTSTVTPSGQPNPPKWIGDERTWLSQSTWVTPVAGCQGTVYVFWGDHWYGTEDTKNPGKHNDQATYVFQPLVFDGIKISMPTYHETWNLDVGAGTWSP
jgi:hypothetical protein